MRRLLLFVVPTAVIAVLALWVIQTQRGEIGGSPLEHSRPRPQGDFYVLSFPAEPKHLNPLTTSDPIVRKQVLELTHDRLLALESANGELGPALIVRWRDEGDGRSFELELRDGVRFADGAALSMADVLFPWEIAQAGHALPGSLWGALAPVESARALDAHRLRLVLRERHFAGLGQVCTGWIVVQRAWFVAEVARRAAALGEPTPALADPRFGQLLAEVRLSGPGTGPYQLGEDPRSGEVLWRPGQDLWLTQNPRSWRRAASPEHWNLAGVRFLFLGDAAAVRAALRRQEIDFAEEAEAAAMLAADPELAAHYAAHVYGYRTLGPWFVVWNHEHPALGDARVRTALSMLFDRQRIAELLAPRAIAPVAWFRPDSGRVPADVHAVPYDIDGARRLLAEAGYGASRPLSLSIMMPDYRDQHAVLDLVIPDFARGGVELRKDVVAFEVLVERRARRAFDGFVYLWNPDPWNDPHEVFHSSQATPTGDNWMHYRSDAMDAVLDAARRELDPVRRQEYWAEFCRIFQRDQPVTLLYHQQVSVLLHRRFRGVEIDDFGLGLRKWWVEPAEQLHRWGEAIEGGGH